MPDVREPRGPITIFIRYRNPFNPNTHRVLRRVLHNCFWRSQQSQINRNTGDISANSIKVMVFDDGITEFIDPRIWYAPSGHWTTPVPPDNVWTASDRDFPIVVRGIMDFEAFQSNFGNYSSQENTLLSTDPNAARVVSVSDKRIGMPGSKYIELIAGFRR